MYGAQRLLFPRRCLPTPKAMLKAGSGSPDARRSPVRWNPASFFISQGYQTGGLVKPCSVPLLQDLQAFRNLAREGESFEGFSFLVFFGALEVWWLTLKTLVQVHANSPGLLPLSDPSDRCA